LHAGVRGTLEVDGVNFPLPFIVRAADDDGVHVSFVLDAATEAAFHPITQRLAVRFAA
jgi:regulator of sirC expression with transglutaminase-like and TPR domain